MSYEASALSFPSSGSVDVPSDEANALELLNDLQVSYAMAEKRSALIDEFTSHAYLDLRRARGLWDGSQPNLLEALEIYVANEPTDGVVGNQLRQFLDEIGYEDVSATAVKTSASKEEILQTLDFSQGPWTEAEPLDYFLIMNTEETPPVETKVYLLWDNENLYVGYENVDHNIAEMVVSDDAPNGWWASGADDSVETFVTGDPSSVYLGFFSNPNGVKFARTQSGGLQPDVTWEIRANIGSDRWSTIQVIPFAEIEFDPSGTQILQALFFRNYHGQSVFMGWNGGAPWNARSFNPVHLVERDEPSEPTPSLATLQQHLADLADENAFASEAVIRALNLHVTAVRHFEDEGVSAKVIEHMNGFKVLIDHQRSNDFMTEHAYQLLVAQAQAIIEFHQVLVE